MARWARPEPSNSSQRRKWNLEGNQIEMETGGIFDSLSTGLDRTSLRNLHGSSTENGDSNSQYEIARRILENDAGERATNELTSDANLQNDIRF